jgi:hypothetical protein
VSSTMPNMQNIPVLASSSGPAWLPAAARDARQFAYWGQLITGVMFIVAVIMASSASPRLVGVRVYFSRRGCPGVCSI